MLAEHIASQIYENFAFEPTPAQKNAIDRLGGFLCGDAQDRIFILNGYAGTGKTSLIAALVRGHAMRSMMSSPASNPLAETVTSSPGANVRASEGITTSVTKGIPSPSSELHAQRKVPSSSKSRYFFIVVSLLSSSGTGGGPEYDRFAFDAKIRFNALISK